MNRAPINAFAINGNYTIPLTLGASVTLEAGLPITYGLVLSGTASVEVAAASQEYKVVTPALAAELEVAGESAEQIAPGVFGEAQADTEVDAGINERMIFHPTLTGDIRISPELLAHVVFGTRGAGLAKLVVQGDLESAIKPAPYGAGIARLRVESALNSKVAKTHRPKMATSLWLDARGKANLHMYSPQGDAAIRVQSAGSGRFGGKLRLSGRGHLELAASLKPDWWRHVHASGSAAVKVLMVAERHGFPVIPSEYHPAHPSWQLPVGAEDWTFIVAPEGDRDADRRSA